jgi:hypothetical protein
MGNLQTETAAVTAPPRRWPFFLLGVLLFILGPAVYAVQFSLKHLGMPWYLPILATLGVLFMLVSVWQRRGLLRSGGLVLFVLLCAAEWFLALIATRAPVYQGPAQPGRPVPAFATTLADGKAFSNQDLEKGIPTVLVFFRGRW